MQSGQRSAALTCAARRAPAAGPGSMRRPALWLWLCALALRLQPALPVSVARGRAGRRREAGVGRAADVGGCTWRGRGSGDFPSSRASPAGPGTRSPEIKAPAPITSAVGGRRTGSAARGGDPGPAAPSGAEPAPGLRAQLGKTVPQAKEPASLRRRLGSPAPTRSPRAPRRRLPRL